MKKRLAVSLLLGFLFLIISLGHKTGKGPEPMPYVNSSQGTVNGIVLEQNFPTPNVEPSLAERGWPKAIVSITDDEDSPGNYYKSLIVKNTVIDYLVFVVGTFVVITILSKLTASKSKK